MGKLKGYKETDDRLTILAVAYHLGVTENTAKKYISEARQALWSRYVELVANANEALTITEEDYRTEGERD